MRLKGFALIEIIIVIALMSMLGFVSSMIYSRIKGSGDLHNTFVAATTSVTRARTRAQSGDMDSSWGVKFDSEIRVFRGNSFSAREISFDEVTPVSATITSSSSLEIIFSKRTGYPNVTSTIVITNHAGAIKTFHINEKGAIIQ